MALTDHQREELNDRGYAELSGREFATIPGQSFTDVADAFYGKGKRKAPWTPPDTGTLYIPLMSVKAFERKHGIQLETNAQEVTKQDRSPAPELSAVGSDKWYRTYHAAHFLGVRQKYLQNDLIPNKKLTAEKRGGRYFILGKEIMKYAARFPPKS